MNEFTQKKLGETKIRFIDGDRSEKYPSRSEFQSSGIMFLNAESIKTGKITKSTVNYITEEKYLSIRKGRIEKFDILLTTRGNGIGDVAFVDIDDNALINAQMLILRVSEDPALFPPYLYYFLKTKYAKEQIGIFSSGSAQPQIPIRDLKHLPIIYPSLLTQKKIAAILSAYDDLIENNTRRIALLERMSEELYKEWFVRMRFPGHEQTRFVKGIPEGWAFRPFSEIVHIKPRTPVGAQASHPFVGMEALSTNSMIFSYSEDRKDANGSKFINGDTLFPRITPCLENGKRGYVMTLPEDTVGVGSTEFIVFRERVLSSEMIYLLANTDAFRKHAEISMVGASGRQRVNEKCFEFFLVKTPPVKIINEFSLTVKPMFQSIKFLFLKNQILQQTRDRLLTRLISGKLSVEDLDIVFPPSMLEGEMVQATHAQKALALEPIS